MLKKPQHGWTDFKLEGTSVYSLSYLNDIAFEWLEQAIHGLSTMQPFCVHGMLEPNRFICIVSYWDCHIIVEPEDNVRVNKDKLISEYSYTNMLDFCKLLFNDIINYIDEWVNFYCSGDYEDAGDEKEEQLLYMLGELHRLIELREERFAPNHGFW